MSRFEQDWDEVIIHGSSKPAVKGRTKEQTASRAMQSGATVTAVRKETHKPTSTKPGYKLDAIGTDDEPDVVQHKQLSRNVSLRIQQARQAKGWTQKELATKISEKPQVVNDYEAGRGIPNPAVLAKMERALGVKLRGKI